jgi:hypothetical protein
MVGFHNDRFPPRDTLRGTPGFPQHPHCGFETVTISLPGSDCLTDHADSEGGRGRYGDGDVQWMTAGRGMAHSEMVALKRGAAENVGAVFQLWLNLPAASKSAPPFTRMLWHEDLSVTRGAGGGSATEIAGPDAAVAPPPDSWAADAAHHVRVRILRVDGGASVAVAKASPATNLRLYPFRVDAGAVLEVACGADTTRVTKADGRVTLALAADATLKNAGDGRVDVLQLEGVPIGEEVFWHGPFVAASKADLNAAFAAYQRGALVPEWPWKDSGPTHDTAARFYETAAGFIEERGVPVDVPRTGPASYLPEMGIVRPAN